MINVLWLKYKLKKAMWKGWQWRVVSWYLNYLGLPLESNIRESISRIVCWREFKNVGGMEEPYPDSICFKQSTYLILVGWVRKKDHLIIWDMVSRCREKGSLVLEKQ